MTTYILICILLTVFYAVIMTMYHHFWEKTPVFDIEEKDLFEKVSVIIPVRNESANIGQLINDLLQQSYPEEKIEIIVVDDYSDDGTSNIVRSFKNERVRLIELSKVLDSHTITNAYKKKALEIGISYAEGDLIMTTDGDCRVHPDWIKTMVGIKKASNSKLITGAVIMTGTEDAFRKFQSLDFVGMMGITAAMLKMKIYNMANGANLLYEKAAFEEVGGFKGIDHLASGDDMLLMYKMAQKYNGAVAYAKHPEAVVYTSTLPDLSSFLQQRFRWTAKSKDYQDKKMTWILGLVFLSVALLFANVFLIVFFPFLIPLLLFQIITKVIVDYRLLKSTSEFYSKANLMDSFFSSQILHILYIVFVGSMGNLLKFEWKGRKQTK